jgi:hypothetical protein
MPTSSYQGSNYWVDVVLSTTPPVDNTAPTVTAFSPTSNTTGAATSTTPTVTFSEAMSAASITTSTVFLRGPNNAVVTTTLAYNASTRTVTLTPSAALANSTTYTIVVTGGASGVKDLAGNALASSVTSSFTTAAAPVVGAPTSLWPNNPTPGTVDSGDGQAVELGVRFTANVNGYITGVRFYKSAANTGTHTANLWTANGQLLATATFTNETGSGWQTVNFSSPVAITAGTTYVASYYTSVGRYAVTRSYFASAFNSGPLRVPANGGVYRYGASGFPNSSYQGSNYWVEPVFTPLQ